jgi:hypothetical protein
MAESATLELGTSSRESTRFTETPSEENRDPPGIGDADGDVLTLVTVTWSWAGFVCPLNATGGLVTAGMSCLCEPLVAAGISVSHFH